MDGNILNLVVGPTETDYHFKDLSVYGTMPTIVDEIGKEVIDGKACPITIVKDVFRRKNSFLPLW